ncbi:MAG: response regulator [Planctomycetota bacterium]
MHATTQRRAKHRLGGANTHSARLAHTRNPRILFIDDDPDLQATLEMRLRPYAVEVEHAYFGTQGIIEAIKSRPDMVLMDLAMPNGSGEYVLETMRRNRDTAAIPVVVFTGMRDASVRRRVISLGADGYLQKPASLAELIDAIGRHIPIARKESGGPHTRVS